MRTDITPLTDIMAQLRDPKDGCPWDLEQDFSTIAPYTIEEAYEVADAIERHDLDGLKDELGDLLLQVVFHSQMASELGAFGLQDVVSGICDKMIRRHPHVFGESTADTSEAVLTQWDAIKQQEKGAAARTSALSGISPGLPSLMLAQKLQKKAAKVGFDWPEVQPVLDKIQEETAEVVEAMTSGDPAALAHEVGDLLFSVVNLARKLGVDAETALSATNARFTSRFASVEQQLANSGKSLQDSTLAEMDAAWDLAKAAEEKLG
jgi:MazG family protein